MFKEKIVDEIIFLLNFLGCHWLIKLYLGVEFYSTSSVLCSPSQTSLLPSPFIPPLPSSPSSYSPFLLVITILLSVSKRFFFFLNIFTFFIQPPQLQYPLTAVSLFLFCLLLNFVHNIVQISETTSQENTK